MLINYFSVLSVLAVSAFASQDEDVVQNVTTGPIHLDLTLVEHHPDRHQDTYTANSRAHPIARRTAFSQDLTTHPALSVRYFAAVMVGGRQYKAALDTGSDTSWFYGTQCVDLPCATVHNKYPDTKESGTSKEIKYVDKTKVEGLIFKAAFGLVGMTPANNIPFVVVRTGDVVLREGMSGLIGLSPRPRIASNDPAWYGMLPGDEKSFGIYLGRKVGRVTMGGVDHKCHSHALQYVNVQPRRNPLAFTVGGWRVPLTGVTVGTHRLSLKSFVVFDTGASIGMGPRAGVQALYKAVFGPTACDRTVTLGHNVFCDLGDDVPSSVGGAVKFAFGQVTLDINPKTLFMPHATRYVGNIALTNERDWLFGQGNMLGIYVHYRKSGNVFSLGLAPSRRCVPEPDVEVPNRHSDVATENASQGGSVRSGA